MSYWWYVPFVSGTSFFLTAALRRYALSQSLMDIPNERSSHSIPTPRGGGVAIVITFLLSLSVLFGVEKLALSDFLGVALGGMFIAGIGFLDDHGHIAARWRLFAHFLASAWVLFWLGGLPPIVMFGFNFGVSWLGYLIAAFYLVWMLNLYNFMDGIDGLASVEAICVCLGACFLYWTAGADELVVGPLLLAASVAGFLCWNFPPAKIFMGDAGSGFLGIILGALSLQAAWTNPLFLWGWLILLGVFIVDATFTLARRLLRGDKVYEAHRSHAYQFAARQVGRHLPVTMVIAAINVFWLLPIALCVGRFGLNGVLGVILAYVPLIGLAIKFHAGELDVHTVKD